jgi:hypothetical protein
LETSKFDELHLLSPADEKKFWRAFEKTLSYDDGSAAKGHLAAGRSITYRDPQYANQLIQEWPDGRREIIHAGIDGSVTVLRSL